MLSLTIAILALIVAPARAWQDGLYLGTVERVIDGDTLVVDVPKWPDPFRHARIRVYGIDTPESKRGRGGAKCAGELQRGKSAKAIVKQLLPVGSTVGMEWMAVHDKYGRPIMRVFLRDGTNLGRALLKMRVAGEYSGGKKQSWCAANLAPAAPFVDMAPEPQPDIPPEPQLNEGGLY